MPLNLKSIFASGAKELTEALGNAFDKNFTNKEEREAAKLEAIKELNRNLEEMNRQANDLEKSYLLDIAKARDMQIAALQQNDVFSKRFIYYFSIFWSIVSSAYIAGITFLEVPSNNIRVVDTILGFMLGTAIAAMFSYFYGSTIGSKTKNDQVYGAISDKLKESK